MVSWTVHPVWVHSRAFGLALVGREMNCLDRARFGLGASAGWRKNSFDDYGRSHHAELAGTRHGSIVHSRVRQE